MSTFTPTVLVTGVSRGIGTGIAKSLLSRGCNLVGISRTATAEIEELKKIGGERFVDVRGDVASLEDVQKAIVSTIARFGALDSVILNAGVLTPIAPLRASANPETIEGYLSGFQINTLSNVTLLGLAIPHLNASKMEGGARVVFVSSGAAERAIHGWGMYCSSKSAQHALCMQLALEEPSITAVAVKPGIVDSFMQDTIRSSVGAAGMPDSQRQMFLDLHAQGKLGDPLVVGARIAGIGLTCPREVNGKLVDHTDKVFDV